MKQHRKAGSGACCAPWMSRALWFAWFQSSDSGDPLVQRWYAAQLPSVFCSPHKAVHCIKNQRKQRNTQLRRTQKRSLFVLITLEDISRSDHPSENVTSYNTAKQGEGCLRFSASYAGSSCLEAPSTAMPEFSKLKEKREFVHQGLTSCFSALFALFWLSFLVVMFSVVFQISSVSDRM